jgi:5'-3' exonuclease
MIAIIDGDVLCYQACESRWKQKCDGEKNIIALDEAGQRKALEFTKQEDAKYLRQAWERLNRDLFSMVENVFATDFLMSVKGEDNFRNLMYPEYKMNRHADPNKQNLFVPILRKLAVAEDLATESTGREADDMLRIWAEECRAIGEDYIICSIDKDLRCIPGKHYLMHILGAKNMQGNFVEFNGISGRIIDVSEEEAMRHYYEQLLKGDPTDNIPGVPRVGEVKAQKILAPFSNEEDFQEKVVEQYIMAYQEDWLNFLLSNGKMIHLQKTVDDYFSCLDWPIVKELL